MIDEKSRAIRPAADPRPVDPFEPAFVQPPGAPAALDPFEQARVGDDECHERQPGRDEPERRQELPPERQPGHDGRGASDSQPQVGDAEMSALAAADHVGPARDPSLVLVTRS